MQPLSLRDPLRTLTAPLGARRVCLSQWDAVEAAAVRLARGEGDEALHDFRVAVRRMRSLLRAYRPVLEDTVRRRSRRRLRELAHITNLARDLEVQHERLRAAGEEALAVVWSLRKEAARGEATARVGPAFEKLREPLRAELSELRVRFDALGNELPSTSFATFGAALVADAARDFLSTLASIEGLDDTTGQHLARIEGKRLRYLVEPWRAEVPVARGLLDTCKALQDTLGELHDVAVWLEVLSVDAPPLTVDVRERLRGPSRDERSRLFTDVQAWMNGGERSAFVVKVEMFVSALVTPVVSESSTSSKS